VRGRSLYSGRPHRDKNLWTKLRPGVHGFLSGLRSLYELHIYTMGDREYAAAMAELLDPAGHPTGAASAAPAARTDATTTGQVECSGSPDMESPDGPAGLSTGAGVSGSCAGGASQDNSSELRPDIGLGAEGSVGGGGRGTTGRHSGRGTRLFAAVISKVRHAPKADAGGSRLQACSSSLVSQG
jgi:hypothetical protein